ncbi:MAG: VanW family protein, partial [Clostridiales bacterium]
KVFLIKGNPEKSLNKKDALSLIKDKISLLEYGKIEMMVEKKYSKDYNLDSLYKKANRKEKNATIDVNGNFKYKIKSEEFGTTVDKSEIEKNLKNILKSTEKPIKLKSKNIEPKINSYTLRYNLFKDNLYSFYTEFNENDIERTENLRVAAEKINGTIIKSGEIFSFAEVVGSVSEDNGFKSAKVYQNGLVALGVGGGICQVATTLHNVVLRVLGLEIIDRKNHSFTVSYVDPGFDAAISTEADKNYSFVNNTKYPIKVLASLNYNKLKMSIKGTKIDDKKVELWSETVSIIPYETSYKDLSTLDPGVEFVKSEPKNGAIVDTYRKIIENGVEIKKEKIYRSKYIPLNNYVFD